MVGAVEVVGGVGGIGVLQAVDVVGLWVVGLVHRDVESQVVADLAASSREGVDVDHGGAEVGGTLVADGVVEEAVVGIAHVQWKGAAGGVGGQGVGFEGRVLARSQEDVVVDVHLAGASESAAEIARADPPHGADVVVVHPAVAPQQDGAGMGRGQPQSHAGDRVVVDVGFEDLVEAESGALLGAVDDVVVDGDVPPYAGQGVGRSVVAPVDHGAAVLHEQVRELHAFDRGLLGAVELAVGVDADHVVSDVLEAAVVDQGAVQVAVELDRAVGDVVEPEAMFQAALARSAEDHVHDIGEVGGTTRARSGDHHLAAHVDDRDLRSGGSAELAEAEAAIGSRSDSDGVSRRQSQGDLGVRIVQVTAGSAHQDRLGLR